eukprot:UN06133
MAPRSLNYCLHWPRIRPKATKFLKLNFYHSYRIELWLYYKSTHCYMDILFFLNP